MKPPAISPHEILALSPACLTMTVPEEYRDENGHMNMRWYLAIFDDAGDVLHDRIGLTREYHRQRRTGTFDLEHHLHFLSEVNPGDDLAVYMRFVARSAKRLHYLMFMVNVTRGKLAAIFECMNAFADLTVRKTAPFPDEIVRNIDGILARHEKLDWPPPLSGAMQV
jgi:acyl-CoA thioester hydrolase